MSRSDANPRRKPLLGKRARGIIVSVVVLFGLQWLEFKGWLPLLNGRLVDQILSRRSSQPETPASAQIYTIGIDDLAYKDDFNLTSPMYPERVLALVKIVSDANPKVIGVDIRTEGQEYSKNIGFLENLPSSIVWISSFTNEPPYVAPFSRWLFGARDHITVTPSAVLGTSPFLLPRLRQTNWGIPLFPKDEDDAVRRFSRVVAIAPDSVQGGGDAPSWARRVADVYCEPECKSESADEIYISYAGVGPSQYSVSKLFSYSDTKKAFEAKDEQWQTLKGNLLGKIVLIGGIFHESGDFYRTPQGHLPGLVVNAYAVKAELNGSGFEAVSQPLAWILDLMLGLLIVAICDEKIMKPLDRYKFLSFIPGWQRKRIILSSAVVLLVCTGSLFVAHGRYLLGFVGEGAAVLIDRARDLWEFSKKEPEPEKLKAKGHTA